MVRFLLMWIFCAACGSAGDARDLPAIVAEREVPRSSTQVSWVSTIDPHRLNADQLPNIHSRPTMLGRIQGVLSSRTGFCSTCNVVFEFDGVVRPSATEAWFEGPDGDVVSADWEWRAERQTLTMRPEAGHAFAPRGHYVARLRTVGDDGLPIVAETSFRAGDPAHELRTIREILDAEPVPKAHVERVWRDEQLGELLGDGQTAPGFERGAAGRRAVRHTSTSVIVTGSFAAPRFLSGEGSEVGVVQRLDGEPVVTGSDDVPFVLIVPKGADLENLPVAVVHHGFASSRAVAMVLADTAGQAGWAVLGIDAYQHGARARSASDRRNVFRGIDGADGFVETQMLDVVSRIFGLAAVPDELRLSPEYALSAFTQFAADALSTVRFVRDGDHDALRRVAGLHGLRFDRDRVVFVGNSMGAVVGTAVVAAEPRLAGAVLNVMPGSIIETLVESGEFRPMSQRLFLPLLGVEHAFDGVDRRMLMDPTVDLFRWVMEPVDPLALARSRVVDNVLVQLAGHDEVAAPGPSASVVVAGGVDQVTWYEDAMHGMLEVAEQHSEFERPLVPPLTRREEPLRIVNPIDEVHEEITAFLLAIEGDAR